MGVFLRGLVGETWRESTDVVFRGLVSVALRSVGGTWRGVLSGSVGAF